MTDFSELCPLFDTGVFNEFTFPEVSLSDISACANALMFSADAQASSSADFNFGRTVIVTNAWLRVRIAPAGSCIIHLKHHTTMRAAGTIMGTLSGTTTGVGFDAHAWVPMIVTAATFDSAAVLGLAPATVSSDNGVYDLMIRYKEK